MKFRYDWNENFSFFGASDRQKTMIISERFVDKFIADGWKSNPLDELIPILLDHRDQALPLALLILDRIPEGGTFFDLLLSHLNEKEFKNVVQEAVKRLESRKSESIESVIAYASLQYPRLLTPFLREIFSFRPNSGAYYEEWPWRSADDTEIEFLKKIVETRSKQYLPSKIRQYFRTLKEVLHIETRKDIRDRAWLCLIETRRLESIEFAAEHFQHLPEELGTGIEFEAYAHLVGLDTSSSPPRKLHSDAPYHIIFPTEYFDDSERPIWRSRIHPTWKLKDPAPSFGNFGGKTREFCGACGASLHRLIKIDDAISTLKICLPTIELCTCLSCLGWEIQELFFVHDELGVGIPIRDENVIPKNPQFPSEPLKESVVELIPSPARWSFQDWCLSRHENLNRIGGAPSWVQGADYPKCPKCCDYMIFIAQLDSELPTIDGGEFLWGSGGICYIFFCNRCRVSANLWQCT